MTDRRSFVRGLALAAFALPTITRAQPARKVPRIGILGNSPAADLVGPEPRSRSLDMLMRKLRHQAAVSGHRVATTVEAIR